MVERLNLLVKQNLLLDEFKLILFKPFAKSPFSCLQLLVLFLQKHQPGLFLFHLSKPFRILRFQLVKLRNHHLLSFLDVLKSILRQSGFLLELNDSPLHPLVLFGVNIALLNFLFGPGEFLAEHEVLVGEVSEPIELEKAVVVFGLENLELLPVVGLGGSLVLGDKDIFLLNNLLQGIYLFLQILDLRLLLLQNLPHAFYLRFLQLHQLLILHQNIMPLKRPGLQHFLPSKRLLQSTDDTKCPLNRLPNSKSSFKSKTPFTSTKKSVSRPSKKKKKLQIDKQKILLVLNQAASVIQKAWRKHRSERKGCEKRKEQRRSPLRIKFVQDQEWFVLQESKEQQKSQQQPEILSISSISQQFIDMQSVKLKITTFEMLQQIIAYLQTTNHTTIAFHNYIHDTACQQLDQYLCLRRCVFDLVVDKINTIPSIDRALAQIQHDIHGIPTDEQKQVSDRVEKDYNGGRLFRCELADSILKSLLIEVQQDFRRKS